ncbi:hypothetical protein BDV38DRAFT_246807 [Aspergillus pseudotamarii]|uniref:Uncharacterized protein n=1 Tax=Aspergillus pseudotamarii TaxID=132259 RepID=A0A5N6SS69_ASPPS|nr:uncharacterized protein BDV38DRAFT_246807 [Aspergillus pseudotamarii]KAE8137462.1 hypothetical protein BDV38DRAFT_246807 [Aspergillus pseudotamarii]
MPIRSSLGGKSPGVPAHNGFLSSYARVRAPSATVSLTSASLPISGKDRWANLARVSH